MQARPLALPLSARLRRAATGLVRLPARVLSAAALARSRRSLAGLDDHLLRDIGLTRAEALKEAARKDWDAPSHWCG
jgi:uncharacterized protein YjiS (DUF1127 family)